MTRGRQGAARFASEVADREAPAVRIRRDYWKEAWLQERIRALQETQLARNEAYGWWLPGAARGKTGGVHDGPSLSSLEQCNL